ncbi:molybdenum cofactor cytidylyltransferase [Paenibacillus sp. UNC496MF]|uniref:nucleotidyltransferase family protein n=1 Tax=Paenibacillus sp. UNC496MF TaxID=1502753 RepID=UPI0008F0DC26|nr:nucleotidyltransferase family protein [Paenibacillus sp. UNC496MF]SFI80967.1 molybdenum cofactor cytidylyltransferase [Paenibacillus sp. UNC496MF]
MSRVGAVILAAGLSTRMGRFKPLVPLAGKPLFHYAAETALKAGLSPVVLVGGHRIRELAASAAPFGARIEIAENPAYRTGMASSLRTGIAALADRTEAAFVFLADQPLVPRAVVDALLREYGRGRGEGVRIVRPAYAGAPGHPVLFDAGLYAAFAALGGDEGGKSILARHRSALRVVPFADAAWGLDADTPEGLAELEARLAREEGGPGPG